MNLAPSDYVSAAATLQLHVVIGLDRSLEWGDVANGTKEDMCTSVSCDIVVGRKICAKWLTNIWHFMIFHDCTVHSPMWVHTSFGQSNKGAAAAEAAAQWKSINSKLWKCLPFAFSAKAFGGWFILCRAKRVNCINWLFTMVQLGAFCFCAVNGPLGARQTQCERILMLHLAKKTMERRR